MAWRWTALALAASLATAGCKREAAAPAAAPAPAAAAPTAAVAPAAPAPTELKDVIEHTPSYVVGITFPPALNRYPGLAQAVGRYAQAARGELMQAVGGLGNDRPSAPYELSLQFEMLLERPELVAVAADGSRYTGGAHGEPLVARFVWLPQQQRMLTADTLIPDPKGWAQVAGYVAPQLRQAVQARVDAEQLPPEDHDEQVRSADKMIAEGTGPQAQNFSQFQPLVDAAGKIVALRFVFPPYQVGPYSDGTQSVDVPASVLRCLVAPEYAALFAA
ncbi:DUF3298 domain-containing protein [Xanthomonas translucens pv. undulosa]|uniref:DUF3298 and DUF4163 domain-containing protein n=3 Tax=Xanthomonas campestris pv. translucens TaxID=343 RepID=UPI00071E8985|nr:DUF3298 and DUF4163 domain-containing protein [Xanthomonas translucens]QEO26227.1 DUF3298 and DUF4163 domain-containing protein [Xanthomonas translucens pv. undulosa]QSQ40686.1 DUF3298 domain-containing protein [Xanthomonas translucens pv. translucens]QSQ48119.1 DUF3298 domain-containing protein [Xanthomonas translucens pv. undulosa]